MGDVSLKVFECLNHECTNFLLVRADEIGDDFSIVCPACGFLLENGGATKFYSYQLVRRDPETGETVEVIEEGDFEVDHRQYVDNAPTYKYCIICNAAKPLDAFDRHGSRQTQRQGECRQCKTTYNAIKNRTRTSDQHREAAQKRRLYVDVSGAAGKIDSKEIFRRFEGKCFKCAKQLVDENGAPIGGTYQLDHTLPAFYLWPLTTDNGTLLCSEHNNEKSGKWPAEYYNDQQLRKLQALTGLDYELLKGEPKINPAALDSLRDPDNVQALLAKYAAYMDEVVKLRNRILKYADFDFFAVVDGMISKRWVEEADAQLKAGNN
ncbi:MAG: hypothetical protein R2724_34240 [Bryobacterales bacterium]